MVPYDNNLRYQTTIQVNNYYRSNAAELDLDKVAAGAPKRSPTPETPAVSWAAQASSKVISPISTVAKIEHSDNRLPLESSVSSTVGSQKGKTLASDPKTKNSAR